MGWRRGSDLGCMCYEILLFLREIGRVTKDCFFFLTASQLPRPPLPSPIGGRHHKLASRRHLVTTTSWQRYVLEVNETTEVYGPVSHIPLAMITITITTTHFAIPPFLPAHPP